MSLLALPLDILFIVAKRLSHEDQYALLSTNSFMRKLLRHVPIPRSLALEVLLEAESREAVKFHKLYIRAIRRVCVLCTRMLPYYHFTSSMLATGGARTTLPGGRTTRARKCVACMRAVWLANPQVSKWIFGSELVPCVRCQQMVLGAARIAFAHGCPCRRCGRVERCALFCPCEKAGNETLWARYEAMPDKQPHQAWVAENLVARLDRLLRAGALDLEILARQDKYSGMLYVGEGAIFMLDILKAAESKEAELEAMNQALAEAGGVDAAMVGAMRPKIAAKPVILEIEDDVKEADDLKEVDNLKSVKTESRVKAEVEEAKIKVEKKAGEDVGT